MSGGWRLVTLVSQLGLTMVFSILIGLGLGLWIDSLLGTRPLAILVFTLVGVSAGSLSVYRLVSAAIGESEREFRGRTPPSPPRRHTDEEDDK